MLAAPAVSCAKVQKTHTSIQVQSEHSDIPRAMALRLIPCSPRRRIRLVTVVSELMALPRPVGLTKTSADLTPATGARTTRFCRTQPPVFAKRLRRALASFVWRAMVAHGKPALRSRSRPTPLRPPHLIPTFVTTADAPRAEGDGGVMPLIWREMGRGIFLLGGLDRANHVESARKIGVFERRNCCRFDRRTPGSGVS